MARRKSRIPRKSRAAALESLRALREEEDQPTDRSRRPDVSNQELLQELRNERHEAKRTNRQEKRQARKNAAALRQEEGPKAKIEYSGFNPGDLVMISPRANKMYGLERYNLFAGATGVIVEQDDMQLWRGDYEKGRWVQVMGPNGLQQWDIRWCTHIDDLDEEDED
mgnify:FL=1